MGLAGHALPAHPAPRPPTMYKSLRQLRDRTSAGQRALLAGLVLVVAALSYAGWRINDHAWLRVAVPDWVFDDHVIYDGYGNYAWHLHNVIRHPGSDQAWAWLREFLQVFVHADRFVFPLVVALVALPLGGNILWAAILVTLVFSLLSLLTFSKIAVQHFGWRGRDLFWIDALYVTHVGMVGAFVRPMSEPLATYLLLCIIYYSVELTKRRAPLQFFKLGVCLVLAVYTKTILVLSVLMPATALIVTLAKTGRQLVLWSAASLLMPLGLILLLEGLMSVVAPHSAYLSFYRAAWEGVRSIPWTAEWAGFVATAGGLMALLALQVYPVFLVWPRREAAADRVSCHDPRWALHLVWIGVYLAQRLLFAGFSLDHSRARYGVPLVPSILLLAYPGIKALADSRAWGRWVAPAIVAGNLVLWIGFHLALAMRSGG